MGRWWTASIEWLISAIYCTFCRYSVYCKSMGCPRSANGIMGNDAMPRQSVTPALGFCDRIETIICRAGGIGALAVKAGLSRSVIEKYRRGQSDPNRIRLVALAAAGGVSVTWLATGQRSVEPIGNSQPFDPDRLRQVIVGLETSVRPLGNPSPEEWAELVIRGYGISRPSRSWGGA